LEVEEDIEDLDRTYRLLNDADRISAEHVQKFRERRADFIEMKWRIVGAIFADELNKIKNNSPNE
jgi:hypothetical protein